MADIPPRFYRRSDGSLRPVGWLLLGLGAALFLGLVILGAARNAAAMPQLF